LLFSNIINSQNSTGNFSEIIKIKTNATVYITGESVLYKIFCLDEKRNVFSDFSKIAYVELIDSSKKIIFKHKIFLENGQGFGDFSIPTTIETGEYQLISYTNYVLNQENAKITTKSLHIINPYQPIVPNNQTLIMDSIPLKEIPTSLIEKKYKKRTLVSIPFSDELKKHSKAKLTISVRKKDNLDLLTNKNEDHYFVLKPNKAIIPEHRGEIITGKIIAKSSKLKVENISLNLSIPGKLFENKITKTDKNGEFLFNLDQKNSNNDIIIQIIDTEKENYSISIDQPIFNDYSSLEFNSKIELSANFKKELEERSISNQIENAYVDMKKDSVLQASNKSPFYDIKYSKEYLFDDFTRFPTLKETIVEIVDGMYYKKENEKYSLHLKDYDIHSELDLPAMVLVDGLFIQDINELLNHKAELFSKLNLIKGGYYFGSNLYNGIISFSTKNLNYESNLNGDFMIKPKLIRPFPNKIYFQPNYANNYNVSRIPDYRRQLLWEPNYDYKTSNQTIPFYTSDIEGVYEYVIQGYSETGEEILIIDSFEVKD